MSEHPVIVAFPFLPLSEPLEFDKWWLGPADTFEGPWASQALEDMGRRFLKAFRDASGKTITNPALLAHKNDGILGTRPSDCERQALRSAVLFATIDRNDYWTSDKNITHNHVTADNTDYWEQPIDVDSGSIPLEWGARVRRQIFGRRLTDSDFQIYATTETVMPQNSIRLDGLIVQALDDILMRPHNAKSNRNGDQVSIERLSRAISWLEKTWLNTPSIGWEDRLVFLKTAFEALTGCSGTKQAGRKLKSIFESTQSQEGKQLELRTLLWRPNEGTRLRNFNGKQRSITDLEHWYGTLADARNEIIHKGSIPNLQYKESDSVYNGPLVEIGDRVLREAIKVEMGNLGYPEAWRDTFGRCSLRALRSADRA